MEDFDSLRPAGSVPDSGNSEAGGGSSAALAVADILRGAAALIEPEGAWITGHLSDSNDPAVPSTCFCALGAIMEVAGSWVAARRAEFVLERYLGLPPRHDDRRLVPVWNDAPERTQADVVAALREAADLAERDAAPVAVTEGLQARSGEAGGASQ